MRGWRGCCPATPKAYGDPRQAEELGLVGLAGGKSRAALNSLLLPNIDVAAVRLEPEFRSSAVDHPIDGAVEADPVSAAFFFGAFFGLHGNGFQAHVEVAVNLSHIGFDFEVRFDIGRPGRLP